MLAVCREFQILFNETREKALKAIAFSKTLRKDLENGVLEEGISPQCSAIIAEALEEIKVNGLQSLQPCIYAVNSSWADSHIRWYCIVVGSWWLMPPDALKWKAYCTNPGL